ncbi:PRC-barrel domain-containing protein [Afifella pfennigii]|uniref:PRC-barrel domain-containing protein n=1 Tax=Afifella pfennigii TaxID=209897 RepID=UPI00068C3E6E|nr:PRC-barrel domain-containing protein [Afifella pfennigii]
MTKYFATACAALLLAGTAAHAQGAWAEIEDDDMVVDIPVDPPRYTVDDIDDMDIVGSDGEKIGEVEDVLGSSDGTSMAVAAEVGGFLGMGEHVVIIPLDNARIVNGKLVVAMTAEEIEALDEWSKR